MTTDQSREAFEAWWLRERPDMPNDFKEWAWTGWLAASPATVAGAASEENIEITLLRSRLKTIHLAGTHGMSNREVADRVAELENTSDQARQYIQNAQQREHRINELDSRLATLLTGLRGLREVVKDVRVSHMDWAGYLVHKSGPDQQVLEYDSHCPACVLRSVRAALDTLVRTVEGDNA